MSQKVKLLGVKIDNVNFNQALDRCLGFLCSNKQNFVVTPNPEIILLANKDDQYRKILNSADLAVPDGIGLKIASGFKIKNRVTGTDLLFSLLKIAEQRKLRVYGIIYKDGLSTKDEIKSAIYKKFPKLSFELRYSGEGKVEQMIDQFRPDLVFVALGAPDQEKWIAHHIRKFGYVKMYAGIGGGFDFLAETQKRAPAWVRKTGFEWLWRLIRHPNRIGRIFNAVVVFPVKVLFSSSRER